MSQKESPRALLERMTPENLAKMREIAEKIVKADERKKERRAGVSEEASRDKFSNPSEKR